MGVCYLYSQGGTTKGCINSVQGEYLAIDSFNRPFHNLKIFGKTIQNGTPTPDAPVPLESVGDGGSVGVTVAGKNLADDSVLSSAGTWDATNKEWYIPRERNNTFVLWKNAGNQPGQFTLSYWANYKANTGEGSTGVFVIDYTDGTTKHLGTSSAQNNVYTKYTLISDGNKTIKQLRYGYLHTGETWFKEIQFEQGNIATEYEPYNGQTLTIQKPADVPVFLPGIPVSSGGNHTDESGRQLVCDYVDSTSGKYVQRINAVYKPDIVWSINATSANYTGFEAKISGAVNVSNEDREIRCLCNVIRTTSAENRLNILPSISIISSSRAMLMVDNAAFGFTNDVSDSDRVISIREWWNSLGDIVLLYELATPIEHDLSPDELAQYAALHTKYPNTTVFNDCGADMVLNYYTK